MMLEVIDFFWSNDEQKIIYVSNFNAESEDIATVWSLFFINFVSVDTCNYTPFLEFLIQKSQQFRPDL